MILINNQEKNSSSLSGIITKITDSTQTTENLLSIFSGFCLAQRLSIPFYITMNKNNDEDLFYLFLNEYFSFSFIDQIKTSDKYFYKGEDVDPDTYINDLYVTCHTYDFSYVIISSKTLYGIDNLHHLNKLFLKIKRQIGKNTNININVGNINSSLHDLMTSDVILSKSKNENESFDKLAMCICMILNITYYVFDRVPTIKNSSLSFTEICTDGLYIYGIDRTYYTYMIEKYIKKETILVMVDNCKGNLFNNGCLQQSYFIYKQLQKRFSKVQFATIYDNYTKFDIIDISIRNILKTCLYDVRIVINVSLSIHNEFMYKLNGINVIDMFCGNVYILQQEQYIFSATTKSILQGISGNIADEIYTFPMYKEHAGYINLVYDKNVTTIPHYWDSDIVDRYVSDKKLNVKYEFFNSISGSNGKYTFLVFEPNISIHKTSLVPLFICQRIYDKYPNNVQEVIIYCSQKNVEIGAEYLNLDIVKKGLVHFKPRPIMLEVLHQLKAQQRNIVVVSHNIMNDMNFLNMEIIHFGYPIIHNCLPYSGNGLYYKYENEAVSLFDNIISGTWNSEQNNVDLLMLPENSKYPDINDLFEAMPVKHVERELKYSPQSYVRESDVWNIIYSEDSLTDEEIIVLRSQCNDDNITIYDEVKCPQDFLEIVNKNPKSLVYFTHYRQNSKILRNVSENFLLLCKQLVIPMASNFIFEKNIMVRPQTLKYLIDNNYSKYFKDYETMWLSGQLNV